MQSYTKDLLVVGGETPWRRVGGHVFLETTATIAAGEDDRRLAAVGGGASATAARSSEAETEGTLLEEVHDFYTLYEWLSES
eukprot:2449840-Amphidinium_carterae.1